MLAEARTVYLFVYVSDLDRSRLWYRDVLGLDIIDQDGDSVSFDGGQVILTLNRAADYEIGLPKTSDGCADVVFLVDDLESIKASLESRGVKFNPTAWYQPGGLADFYDPDNHWLTLYQPSDEAMSWPSGARIQAVTNARRNGHRAAVRTAAPDSREVRRTDLRLAGSEIIYTFFFVFDSDRAAQFYQSGLGLRDLEGGPCSQASNGDEAGVIKYDTGGMMLTTHFIEPSRTKQQVLEHSCPPRELDPNAIKSVAPALYVDRLDPVLAELAQKSVLSMKDVTRSGIGTVARLEDPSGHILYLYEPSEAALKTATGEKIRSILATPLGN